MLPIVSFKNFRTKGFFWEFFFPKKNQNKKSSNLPKGFEKMKTPFFSK
jgi:hypothetical protein